MRANIVILPGDGSGPDMAAEAAKVLYAVGQRFHHHFVFHEGVIGGIAIDQAADPLPLATRLLVESADAVLLGAVGGPRWSDPSATLRPETSLFGLRQLLGVYAQLRPVTVHPALMHLSPIKPAYLAGADILFMRELAGGAYWGSKSDERDANGQLTKAADLTEYTAHEIERIVRLAASAARSRRGRLTSVDKANVLACSRLWRAVAMRVLHDEYPDVALECTLADVFALELVQSPSRYDVVVADNLFGDLFAEHAAVLAGPVGMLPWASLGESQRNGRRRGIFGGRTPLAPAGVGDANPAGTILGAALLLRYALGLEHEAHVVERAVSDAIAAGCRTADCTAEGEAAISTREFGDAVVVRIARLQ